MNTLFLENELAKFTSNTQSTDMSSIYEGLLDLQIDYGNLMESILINDYRVITENIKHSQEYLNEVKHKAQVLTEGVIDKFHELVSKLKSLVSSNEGKKKIQVPSDMIPKFKAEEEKVRVAFQKFAKSEQTSNDKKELDQVIKASKDVVKQLKQQYSSQVITESKVPTIQQQKKETIVLIKGSALTWLIGNIIGVIGVFSGSVGVMVFGSTLAMVGFYSTLIYAILYLIKF